MDYGIYYSKMKIVSSLILSIILLSSSVTLGFDPKNFLNYANATNGEDLQTFQGYLNIGHGHQEDGTPFYVFHLFDFDKFEKPTIILELTDDVLAKTKELVELSGKKVIVTGKVTTISENPPYIVLDVVFIKPYGATIELDQKVYTWTDKVFFTIVSPAHNLDSNLVDKVGETANDPIIVQTRTAKLENYTLIETGTDTGIFTGEVILTGFTHNADGDINTGTDGKDMVTTAATGSGPTDGKLSATENDGITISFEFSEDEIVVGSALIQWNIGEVNWLEASYPATGTGVVRVVDPDMNLNPESVDNFRVDVWSDSDAGGIDLTVTETNEATGIFEGMVSFTITDESSGHRLRVAEGDTITAEYEDNTLPDPYTTADKLEITGTTIIGTVTPTLETMPESDTNNQIIRVTYQESTESIETYRLLYDLFHDESKLIFTSHERTNPNGPGVPSSLKSVTIPVRFSDIPTMTPHLSSYFQTIFYNLGGDSLASYWQANSYGKLDIQGQVVDWQTLPADRNFYCCQNGQLRAFTLYPHAVDLVDSFIDFDGADGVIQNLVENNLQQGGNNGDDVDQLIFITNTQASAGQLPFPRTQAFAYLHPIKIQTSEGDLYVYQSYFVDNGPGFPVGADYQKGYGVVAHEVGHNFHWYHTPLFLPHDTYSDPWSLLSGWNDNVAPSGVISYQKRKANWIDPQDVIEIPQGQSKIFKLDFLQNQSPSSEKYLMAKVPFGTNGEFYTIEARMESTFDHIPKSTGLMIYQFNPDGYGNKIKRQNGLDNISPVSAVEVIPLPCKTTGPQGVCVLYDYSALAVNPRQTYLDSSNNIRIILVSESSDSMIVFVSNNDSLPDLPTINVSTNNIGQGDNMSIDIEFRDLASGNLVPEINYDIRVTQNTQVLLDLSGHHDSDGIVHHTTIPLPKAASSTDPVNMDVTFQGYGTSPPVVGMSTAKSIQVVPEFGTFAVLIFSFATIITLLVVTKIGIITKTR